MFALRPWRKEGAMARELARPLVSLREEFAPLFERFFAPWPMPAFEMFETPWERELEVRETEKEVLVFAELPGFELAEIEVRLLGNELTIEAKHLEPETPEKKEEAEKVKVRRTMNVCKTMTLPAGLELEKLEATYRSGVLEVRIPKTPEAVGRRIEVKP